MVKRPMVRQSPDPFNADVLFHEMLLRSYGAYEQFIIAPPTSLFRLGHEPKYPREFYTSLSLQLGLTNLDSVQNHKPSTKYIFNLPDVEEARRLWHKLSENIFVSIRKKDRDARWSDHSEKIHEALESLNNRGYITAQVVSPIFAWPTIAYNPGCNDESIYLFFEHWDKLDVAKMDEDNCYTFRKEVYEPIRDDPSKSQPVPYIRR